MAQILGYKSTPPSPKEKTSIQDMSAGSRRLCSHGAWTASDSSRDATTGAPMRWIIGSILELQATAHGVTI